MPSYAAAHECPQGAGDARPTALQIIKDYNMEGKLAGKVAVVTGASSGIGVETVRALATTGLKFFLPVRNPEKAKAALGDAFDPENTELVIMDQTSLQSVRHAAAVILAKTDKINLLINNAGIMAVPELQHSKDGYELQFATNHLSHFLLFQLLKPALLAGSSPGFQSRVVSVASDGHKWNGLNDSDNYSFQKGGYHPQVAYAQSKTANIYMANELERRYSSQGLHATGLHPGVVPTGLARFMSEEQVEQILNNPNLAKFWKSIEQGAATTVWAAVASEWEGTGGRYLSDCADVVSLEVNGSEPGTAQTYAQHTYNPEQEARLWRDSLVMVGVQDDQ